MSVEWWFSLGCFERISESEYVNKTFSVDFSTFEEQYRDFWPPSSSFFKVVATIQNSSGPFIVLSGKNKIIRPSPIKILKHAASQKYKKRAFAAFVIF
jgi:hypothetical protein